MTPDQLKTLKELQTAVNKVCEEADEGASLEDLQPDLELISGSIDDLLSELDDSEDD